MTGTQSSFAKKRLAVVLAGGIAGVVVGLAGVYGIATLTRNVDGDATCQPAVELAKKIAPLARGEVAAVNVAKSPLRIPDLAFQDSAGKPLTSETVAPPGRVQRPWKPLARGGGDLASLIRQLVRAGIDSLPDGALHEKVVEAVERELIEEVVRQCSGVQVTAAKKLGINRNTLHKKVSDYAGDVPKPPATEPPANPVEPTASDTPPSAAA